MNKQANEYYDRGLRLIQLERYSDAVEFFTKAIEEDPTFADAYHNRGETYILLNRFVEGNTDIQKAKNLLSGKYTNKKPDKTVKLNMQEVDSIYDTVFPEDSRKTEDTPLEFEDSIYDYIFSDDTVENEITDEGLARNSQQSDIFPAVLEYLGGKRREVAGAILFKPTMNDISIIRQDGEIERVIPLEQFGCIRTAGLPGELSKEKDNSCFIETVETIDGNTYHEFVPLNQDVKNVIFGFSTKEQTRFSFSIFPRVNISNRCQQRYLGEVLLEKRFIASDMLKRSLDEYHSTKNMRIGKIIAQKARIHYSVIEEELKKFENQQFTGLKTGEILLLSGLVSEKHVLEALEYQEDIRNMKIGQFLVKKGIVQEKDVYVSLAEKHRLKFVDLRKQKLSKKILAYLPKELVIEHEILPIELNNDTLVVATHLVERLDLCELILKRTRCNTVQFVLTLPTHIRKAIALMYKSPG